MLVVDSEMGKHQAFLIGRDDWIAKHNQNPDSARVSGVNQLRDKQNLISKAMSSTLRSVNGVARSMSAYCQGFSKELFKHRWRHTTVIVISSRRSILPSIQSL
jgi:hypothetical protein